MVLRALTIINENDWLLMFKIETSDMLYLLRH